MTETKEKKDVVPSEYRERYKATGGTCGDFIATKLQGIAKDGPLDAVKIENGIERERWSTFNPGMQRMNLANVLRGRFLKGESISILGKQYNAVHAKDDFNFTLEDTNESLARAAEVLELQQNDRVVAALRKLYFPKAKVSTARGNAALTKANKQLASAQKALQKAKDGLDAAIAAAKEADAAASIDFGDDTKGKAAAEKALTKANDKVGKAEEKVEAAEAKVKEAEAAVAAATPAEA